MSTSDAADAGQEPDFESWVRRAYADLGGFTALVLLVRIGRRKIRLLRSTFLNVVGDELDWGQMTNLLAGAGVAWDGVAFFPVADKDGGPLDNAAARLRLRMLETRVEDDRLVLNEGHFFDAWGRRMRVDEVS